MSERVLWSLILSLVRSHEPHIVHASITDLQFLGLFFAHTDTRTRARLVVVVVVVLVFFVSQHAIWSRRRRRRRRRKWRRFF